MTHLHNSTIKMQPCNCYSVSLQGLCGVPFVDVPCVALHWWFAVSLVWYSVTHCYKWLKGTLAYPVHPPLHPQISFRIVCLINFTILTATYFLEVQYSLFVPKVPLNQGSFRVGTRGNGVHIVKVSMNAKNAPDCWILHIIPVMMPPDPASAPVLGPRHQFSLGSPVFPLFLFYETTTALNPNQSINQSIINQSSSHSINH